ncbi:SHOCT domain-containing protein [Nitrososphaera sp.]|uniref:SHOCT domain-containing protein n=1 Tax=Nitrososphaera sp. TaxID=1971748 RepID=UPI0031728BD4
MSYIEKTLTTESLWEGVVFVDDNIDDFVTNISHSGGLKRYEIKDAKYHHTAWNFIDNPRMPNVYYPPSAIALWVKGDRLGNYMKCTAIFGYELIEKTRGLIRKEKYHEKRYLAKGFILEPWDISANKSATTTSVAGSSAYPRLASYRADIGKDNTINIEGNGIVCFGAGSKSAEGVAARESVTCVFIASDSQPFVASVRKKGRIFDVRCDGSGWNEKKEDKGDAAKTEKKPKSNQDPLTVLKLRLAKGEITKEQYEEMRKIIES